MRPLRDNRRRQQVVRTISLPAPVGGLNARDSLANMPPTDAYSLDNWFPESDGCSVRRGFILHASDLPGPVETLMEWNGPSGSHLLAASDGEIYDVTAPGAVGSPLASGKSNDRWQHVNFGTVAGSYIIAVNGADTPCKYDGTAWADIGSGPESAISGSGLVAGNLIHVNVFKQRLFFIEKDSLSFWYLAPNAIGGTATPFTLQSVCRLGGYLMAMATWTRDGGSGPDDLAVFITSEGEVVVFVGTDPGLFGDWQLVGVFQIAPPIGRRCFVKVGGDLVVITIDGFVSLGTVLPIGRAVRQTAISEKIGTAVERDAKMFRAAFGWQPILYPRSSMLIFNVPQAASGGQAIQYVMNTHTRAWCRFTGMNALCWSLLDENLYFGAADGNVYQADSGASDHGTPIRADAKQAFTYANRRAGLKHFKMARIMAACDGQPPLVTGISVDFRDSAPSSTPSFFAATGSQWDVSQWDTFYWADEVAVQQAWFATGALGYAVSLWLRAIRNGQQEIKWFSTDHTFEEGGVL